MQSLHDFHGFRLLSLAVTLPCTTRLIANSNKEEPVSPNERESVIDHLEKKPTAQVRHWSQIFIRVEISTQPADLQVGACIWQVGQEGAEHSRLWYCF